MDNLYILAYTWQDTGLTIETFRSDDLAIEHLWALVGNYDGNHPMPDLTKTFQETANEYINWFDEQCEKSDAPDFYIQVKIEIL